MIKPINNYVFIKLEIDSVKRTMSGIVYDSAFQVKNYAFGHIYIIDNELSDKWGVKVGDRVVFEKDRCEQIAFKSKVNLSFIDVVLVVIRVEDILSVVPGEKTVLDYI